MITIHIRGPFKSGKSRIALAIQRLLAEDGINKVIVVDPSPPPEWSEDKGRTLTFHDNVEIIVHQKASK